MEVLLNLKLFETIKLFIWYKKKAFSFNYASHVIVGWNCSWIFNLFLVLFTSSLFILGTQRGREDLADWEVYQEIGLIGWIMKIAAFPLII